MKRHDVFRRRLRPNGNVCFGVEDVSSIRSQARHPRRVAFKTDLIRFLTLKALPFHIVFNNSRDILQQGLGLLIQLERRRR